MSQPEITPAMLAEIKSKAEKNPPGAVWHKEERVNFVRNSAGWRIAIAECEEDAEHIASADPATVLAMVHEIEQLRSELAVVNLALRNAKYDDWCDMGFELDDEVVDRYSRNAIENARRQLNAAEEQS